MRPIDIEAAVADYASSIGLSVGAYPVPRNLGEVLPYTVVQRTGGATVAKVLDEHDVAFDCYAKTWEAASEAASAVCGMVHDMDGQSMGGRYCIMARLRTLPYNNPDPTRPDLPRVTFSATLTAREI